MDNELILVGQVAVLLGCSADNVRRLTRIGALPAERASGGVRVFRRSVVEQFLRDRADRHAASFEPAPVGV